jgi:hypothetical protein
MFKECKIIQSEGQILNHSNTSISAGLVLSILYNSLGFKGIIRAIIYFPFCYSIHTLA